MIEPWIENGEPFILVGPEGCGKDMIIRHAFSGEAGGLRGGGGRSGGGGAGGKRVKTSTTVLHCNARTTAEHVITKASRISTESGFATTRPCLVAKRSDWRTYSSPWTLQHDLEVDILHMFSTGMRKYGERPLRQAIVNTTCSTHKTKKYFTLFIINSWSYLLWFPVIAHLGLERGET